MNEVDIDRAALTAEADAIVSDLPPDSSSPSDVDANSPEGLQTSGEGASDDLTMEQIEAAAQKWEPGMQLVVSEAFDTIAPAWGVTSEEKQRVAHAFALALGAWVPDSSIPPKYLVLLMAGGSLYSVVKERRDPETGEFKPRKLQSDNASTVNAHDSASHGGGFSTSA